jgi:hypothetical protein
MISVTNIAKSGQMSLHKSHPPRLLHAELHADAATFAALRKDVYREFPSLRLRDLLGFFNGLHNVDSLKYRMSPADPPGRGGLKPNPA